MKRNVSDFNRNHPERLPDEVFITNASDEEDLGEDNRSSWDRIGWKTKRRGQVAYDTKGRPLGERWSGAFPVFAKQSEIRDAEHGILEGLLP